MKASRKVRRINAILLVSLMVTVVAGCASTSSEPPEIRDNDLLNDGYTLLYEAVSGLQYSDEILLIKVESDAFEKVEVQIGEYAAELKAELERIANDYPAIEIDRDPLPEMEKRKRSAVNTDRLKSFAPLVGRTGAAFERTFLLSNSGALNQTRYLCQVMAANEPDESLRNFLLDTEKQFAELYDKVVVLLNEKYFIHNTYEPGKG